MLEKTALLEWNEYKYLDYERHLGLREIETLLKPETSSNLSEGIELTGDFSEEQLKRLVYFRQFRIDGRTEKTLQHELESCSPNKRKKKQSTKYSVHGMHEYKGKFNPQVVRGILNILNISSNARVLDPFTGSGTTLVECAHLNIKASGFDVNPFAVYISNAKLKALSTPFELLNRLFKKIVKTYEKLSERPLHEDDLDNARWKYLRNWFEQDYLIAFENYRWAITKVAAGYEDIFLVLVSDLLRNYSKQEPADLRIRRRFSEYPTLSLKEAVEEKISLFLENLKLIQQLIGVKKNASNAFLHDSGGDDGISNTANRKFDIALTSPPYATALPYIDTQRLSLVWVNLIEPSEIRNLEASLTGTRELSKTQSAVAKEYLSCNSSNLPKLLHEYCLDLFHSLSPDDGFRKQAVPTLLYKYLQDMKKVFLNVAKITKDSAPFALIIGHNRTQLGDKLFEIDTPLLLSELAQDCGWGYRESIFLQTYRRYGLHKINSVKEETLLILENRA